MKKLIYFLFVVILTSYTMLTSCTADDAEYNRQFECYFLFDTRIHNTSLINACVNPGSYGVFCTITHQDLNNVRHLYVNLYGGKSEDVTITTEEERRQSCILGSDNGLIIGRSTLNDGDLYAFDLKCPNCLKDYIYKTLTWDNNGNWVRCPKCNRSYDLNNSGFVVKGESGNKLIRYRASYNGTFLHVSN